jgi:hypothetical protein
MHGPPAVSHHVGRSRWHFGTLAVLGSVALGVTVLLLQSPHVSWTPWVVLFALGASCAMSLRGWVRSDTGTLQWDGQHWLWSGFGEISLQQVQLILDFQKFLLLRLRSEDGCVAWLWVEGRTTTPHHWLAVRRALVAAQRSRVDPDTPQPLLDGEKV